MYVMSPEEFARTMLAVKSEQYDENNDIENCHIVMDSIMMYLLRSLGYDAGVDIFAGTGKGYK